MKSLHALTLIFGLVFLTACGGGSGNGKDGISLNPGTDVLEFEKDGSTLTSITVEKNTVIQARLVIRGNPEQGGSFSFEVKSDNHGLVPPENVQVTGTGKFRDVTITPVTDQTGTANLTGRATSKALGVFIEASLTVHVVEVQATVYTVTASAGTGGTISPLSEQVNHGDTVELTVTPDSGYSIASVTGCGGSLVSNTYTTGVIAGACTVSASFSLPAPLNLIATSGDTEVTLDWNSVAAATDYCVYVSDTAGINSDTASSYDINLSTCTGSSTNSYTVMGLINGTEYFFVVTAKNGSVESVGSTEISAMPETPFVAIGGLNDTGITLCGDYAYEGGSSIHQNNLECAAVSATQTTAGSDVDGDPVPAGQDAFFGRDARAAAGTLTKIGAGHAGFDFTKLDSNGNPLSESATEWTCVRDNVTGLIWEVKQHPNGIFGEGLHDADDSYNWYSTDISNNGGAVGFADDRGDICTGYNDSDSSTYCNIQAFVARVNAVGLCGYFDWRMPVSDELSQIVSNDRINPAVDTAYFPNTRTGFYWSASPTASEDITAWCVNFVDGSDGSHGKNDIYHVRLVRDSQSL